MVKVNRRRSGALKARADPTGRRQALAVGMSDDLARKYALYVDKKKRQNLIGGFQTTGVDSGRQKVYDAENKTRKEFPELLQKLTKPQVNAFFKRVVKSKTYQSLVNKTGQTAPALRFKDKSVKAGSHASSRGVSIRPVDQMDKYTILHELAHTAGNMHHDLTCRTTLVKLVSRFLGVKIAKSLKRNFKDGKVKMSRKTTIETPDTWLAKYRRLEAMRA